MSSTATRKAATRRPRTPAVPASTALIAARRALEQQTALVVRLEAQVRTLSAAGSRRPSRPVHVVPADSEIYWRHRHFHR